jgi:hypothetical protein
MESTLETLEITIPKEYIATLKKFIKALGGKVKAVKKTEIEESLEDVKAGRVSKKYKDVNEMWEDLMA